MVQGYDELPIIPRPILQAASNSLAGTRPHRHFVTDGESAIYNHSNSYCTNMVPTACYNRDLFHNVSSMSNPFRIQILSSHNTHPIYDKMCHRETTTIGPGSKNERTLYQCCRSPRRALLYFTWPTLRLSPGNVF